MIIRCDNVGRLDHSLQSKESAVERLQHKSVFAMALVFLLAGSALAEPPDEEHKPVTIPLKEIWAYDMPGTKKVGELGAEGKPFIDIRRSIWPLPAEGESARKAFAVNGTDSEVLREVYRVLVSGEKVRDTFPPDNNIYVVFFAYQSNRYVHLHKVDRQGNDINVHWQSVPHETQETTEHFALIPLGKLSNGKYRVNIIPSPMPPKYAHSSIREWSDEVARRVVCGSFSFSVSEQGE